MTARNCAERNRTPPWEAGRRPGAAQGPENTPEVSGDTEGQGAADGGQEAREQAGEGETGGMIAGHLDPKDLEGLKKADLERMANDMGLDISRPRPRRT